MGDLGSNSLRGEEKNEQRNSRGRWSPPDVRLQGEDQREGQDSDRINNQYLSLLPFSLMEAPISVGGLHWYMHCFIAVQSLSDEQNDQCPWGVNATNAVSYFRSRHILPYSEVNHVLS